MPPAHTAPPVPVAPLAPMAGPVTRAPTSVFRPSSRYASDDYVHAASTSAPSLLPSSVRAALRDPLWMAAMQEEFDALLRNRTWQLVPRPRHANVIIGKWVFKHKLRPDGTLDRYKPR